MNCNRRGQSSKAPWSFLFICFGGKEGLSSIDLSRLGVFFVLVSFVLLFLPYDLKTVNNVKGRSIYFQCSISEETTKSKISNSI